jgi:hypothetical protein
MNVFVIMLGVSIFLIPNALFALWLTWRDLSEDGTLTERGHKYVSGILGFTAVTLILALMGIVGAIETM